MRFFLPFLNPILAILCVKWAKMGLEGSKMSFLGPKPTQDPMNIVFEQKNLRGKIFFSGPRGPPTERIFRPGQPKGGQSRSVWGLLTLPKRSKHPMVHVKGGVDRPVTPPLANVMTKTRFLVFLGFLGRFRGRLGP